MHFMDQKCAHDRHCIHLVRSTPPLSTYQYSICDKQFLHPQGMWRIFKIIVFTQQSINMLQYYYYYYYYCIYLGLTIIVFFTTASVHLFLVH
jgi:hypothetical protein